MTDLPTPGSSCSPTPVDDAYTVVEQRGAQVSATAATATPSRTRPKTARPRAFDGDLTTAWRVGAFAAVDGERIRLVLDEPITTDHVNLVQPLIGDEQPLDSRRRRSASTAATTSPSISATQSRTDAGQTVTFPARTFRRLEIPIVDDQPRRHHRLRR